MDPGFQRFSSSFRDARNGTDSDIKRNLDIVFLQDTTGSQGPYIKAATQAIRDICDKIAAASEIAKDQIRFGLIAFRDHPPQDYTYVTKPFGFTSDIAVMQKNLSSLVAAGGGDGPEAQTAAMAAALDSEWADGAIKMVVLITDSPPHGLGEDGDGFSESPDQNDALELARQMSEKGITLFVIACEPALSLWKHAVDFYTALARITSGHMFPLLMADELGDFIVGTALETIETEKLIKKFEQVIVKDVYENNIPVHEVVSNLQEYTHSKGIQMNRVVTDNVYEPSSVADRNVSTWLTSKDIKTGSSGVAAVVEPRITTHYNVGIAPVAESSLKPNHSVGRSSIQAGPVVEQTKYNVGGGGAGRRSWSARSLLRRFWPAREEEKRSTFHTQTSSYISPGDTPPAWYIPPATSYIRPATSYISTPKIRPSTAPPLGSHSRPSTATSILQAPVSSTQAHRIVMQSVARNSEVTAQGMSSRSTGKLVSSIDILHI